MNRDEQISEMARVMNKANGLDDTPAWYNDFLPDAEALYNAGYRRSSDVAEEIFAEIDDLKRYILLNENIALKCKRENGEYDEEYWKGKLSAFRQTRSYIDAELKKKCKEGEKGDG